MSALRQPLEQVLVPTLPPLNSLLAGAEGYHRIEIVDGVVLVASDAHYQPGPASTAHKALVQLTHEFASTGQLRAVIMNGDVCDFGRISRHPPIGWTSQASVAEELAVARERLDEIAAAAGPNVTLAWPLGNHDARLETRLAERCPEFAGVTGFQLHEHFDPRWTPCWAVELLPAGVIVKHRWHGGAHAARNNALKSGRSMVTGHLHALNVFRVSDYDGPRWGVDCGCLAIPYSKPFAGYTELSPVDWASGFAVLTFAGGRLLMPELALVIGAGEFSWRGEIHKTTRPGPGDRRGDRPTASAANSNRVSKRV